MNYPYLITSDQHCHSWSAFSKIDADGVNSRLRIILAELARAHKLLADHGGDVSIYAGDLFHVRGKIEPNVFNPTFEAIEAIHDEYPYFASIAIPGNHDLQGTSSESLGNAMQALSAIDRFTVDTKTQFHSMAGGGVIVIPWHQDLNDLRGRMKIQAAAMKASGRLSETDLIIHAPVNGVIKGIPDHGLEAAELAALGFKRVFAGHYHNHKVFEDGKVISIGATTHQTWSDPGTVAGFLLVYEDRVEHFKSEAPQFIDLTEEALDDLCNGDEAKIKSFLEGNYVRIKLSDVSEADIKQWRKDLLDAGALGVNIIATKKASTGRTGASTKAALSLAASVEHFVVHDLKPFLADEVSALAQEILTEAQS